VQDDPIREGESDPGVEGGTAEPPPDDPGLDDMRPEPHDVEPES
jgi:hypothetical protein